MPRTATWAVAFVAAIVGLLFATGVSAGPPLPGESWADPCIVLCPRGDVTFHLYGRRGGGPVAGWPVEVDFCGTPSVHLAPPTGAEPYQIVLGCRVSVLTDAEGIGSFAIKAGGVARDVAIEITSPLVLAVRTTVCSPDQDGDLDVDAHDLELATVKLGNDDPTADFDCDGTVTEADLGVLRAHLGHAADPTPVAERTWQAIKAAFR